MLKNAFFLIISVCTFPLLVGCDEGNGFPVTCDRPESDEPTAYKGGSTDNGVYQSAAWNGEYLYFPGGAYYEIHHQLGEVPDWFAFYVSFERDGIGSGSLAQAAGNLVEIKAISDQSITVVNGTCADFWLLARVGLGSGP